MARDDLDRLLTFLLEFAQDQLTKRGEFHPFAANLNAERKIGLSMADTGDEHPVPEELIEILWEGFREKSREIIAAGICSNSSVELKDPPGRTDTICCELESADGEAVAVYLPYKRRRVRGYDYGELFAVKREAHVWNRSSDS